MKYISIIFDWVLMLFFLTLLSLLTYSIISKNSEIIGLFLILSFITGIFSLLVWVKYPKSQILNYRIIQLQHYSYDAKCFLTRYFIDEETNVKKYFMQFKYHDKTSWGIDENDPNELNEMVINPNSYDYSLTYETAKKEIMERIKRTMPHVPKDFKITVKILDVINVKEVQQQLNVERDIEEFRTEIKEQNND